MNARVRRYEPYFLSPQQRPQLSPAKTSPNWKSKINQEVTVSYNRIKTQNSQSQYSAAEQIDRLEAKSAHSGNGTDAVKSCSTQSNLETPLKRKQLQMFNNQTVSTTIFQTAREKELQSYYSHRIQLLQQECIYLRREFISHCMRHHKSEFEGMSS